MKLRRVKITGIGPVTPAGIGREAFWRGIQEPVSRVRRLDYLPDNLGAFVATWMPNFALEDYVENIQPVLRRAARHTHLAVAGAALALRDAGIGADDEVLAKAVVYSGTSLMDFGAITKETEAVSKRGLRGISPRLIYSSSVACIASSIAQTFAPQGISMAVQSSCCAGLDAIGQGAAMVASGVADIAICGGSEAPLHKHPMVEFRAAELTPANPDQPEKQCRPFDLWRTTGVIGEGAAIFVLEADSSPRPGYCWVDGYAFAGDYSGNICSGLNTAMFRAIKNANINLDAVDVISAWAPGHKIIDAAEARALREVFGGRLSNIAVYSIKGAIGNPLGAAPAIQVAAAALALRDGKLPPTVNWDFPDPACKLSLSATMQRIQHSYSLVNAHGLAGMNSAMVLSAYN
jgi:3-oxoacyl-(acyl-carrier-protein) synthase